MNHWRFWNSKAHYGLLSKSLHWLSAFFFTLMLVWGFVMAGYVWKKKFWGWYAMHKQIGILILFGLLLRVVNRYGTAWVKSPDAWLHGLLYVGLLSMPVSGWVMSSSVGHAPVVFGVKLPIVPSGNQLLSTVAATCHLYAAIIMIVLIFYHIGKLLVQYAYGRNRIKRMWF